MQDTEIIKGSFCSFIEKLCNLETFDEAFELVDEDAVGMGIGTGEFVIGKEKLYQLMKNSPSVFSAEESAVEFDNAVVRCYDNCAFICMLILLHVRNGENVITHRFAHSAQMRNDGDGWKIVMLQATPLGDESHSMEEYPYSVTAECGGSYKVQEMLAKVMHHSLLGVYEADLTNDIWKRWHNFNESEYAFRITGSYEKDIFANAETSADDETRLRLIQTFSASNLIRLYNSGKFDLCEEFEVKGRNGHDNVWMSVNAFLYKDRFDHVTVQFYLVDIDDNKREELRLKKISETDLMTGIYNRDTFMHKTDRYIEEELLPGCGAFFMIDIDNFKSINDTYGHSAGDEVITAVARVLKSTFRKADIIGRLGGDEFAVFYTGKKIEDILTSKAEFIEKEVLDSCKGFNNVTLSIGIALCDKGDNFESLYEKADRALYDRKKNYGKNGYCFFGDNTPEI